MGKKSAVQQRIDMINNDIRQLEFARLVLEETQTGSKPKRERKPKAAKPSAVVREEKAG